MVKEVQRSEQLDFFDALAIRKETVSSDWPINADLDPVNAVLMAAFEWVICSREAKVRLTFSGRPTKDDNQKQQQTTGRKEVGALRNMSISNEATNSVLKEEFHLSHHYTRTVWSNQSKHQVLIPSNLVLKYQKWHCSGITVLTVPVLLLLGNFAQVLQYHGQ